MIDTAQQSGGGSASAGFEEDKHHRRVRHSAISVAVLLPIFLVAGALWLFWRFMVCWGQAYGEFCEVSYGVPLGLAVLIIAALAWMFEVIRRYGGELERTGRIAKSEPGGASRVRYHVASGYRTLHEHHRVRVRRTIFFALVMVAGIIGFVLFWYELPPLLVLFGGFAILVAAVVVVRWMR